MKPLFYDPRPANKLERAIKPPAGHRLTPDDFATLRVHAAQVHSGAAQCISYHKRRRRSRWLLPDGRAVELRGLNPNGRDWAEIIEVGIAAEWLRQRKAVAA